MSREFPDWVNPWSAAEGRRVYRGTLPLSRLKRLADNLASDEGEARFEAAFSLEGKGVGERYPVIAIDVEADLLMICQASLEEYRQPVSRQSRLGVVETEAEHVLLPEGLDPVVAESGRLAMKDLVEDELLLGMPQVPRNPDLDAVRFDTAASSSDSKAGDGDADPAQSADGERQNPFAQLGEMLEKQAQSETDN